MAAEHTADPKMGKRKSPLHADTPPSPKRNRVGDSSLIINNNRFYYRLIWSHLVGHADVCLTVGKSPSWGKPWSGLTRSLFWLQVLLRYRLHEAFLFRRGGLSPVLRVDELSKVRPILLRHFIRHSELC